jgi:hypothetical protein
MPLKSLALLSPRQSKETGIKGTLKIETTIKV